MEWSVHWIAAAIVGAVFLVSGTMEMFIWRKLIDQFTSWGYPRYWPLVTAGLKTAGGIMVFSHQTALIGLAICVLISIAAIATLLVNRVREAYKNAVPLNVALIGLVVASWIAR